MPTDVFHTLKPTGQGGDYASMLNWYFGEVRQLATLDETETLTIFPGDYSATNGGVNFTDDSLTINSSWDTDPTHFVTVITDPSARGDYTFEAFGGPYNHFTIQNTASFSSACKLRHVNVNTTLTSAVALTEGCEAESVLAEAALRPFAFATGKGNMITKNCVGKCPDTASSYVWNIDSATDCQILNCVGQGGSLGVRITICELAEIRNLVCFGAGIDYSIGAVSQALMSNNASEDTTAVGTSPQISIDPLVEFADAAGGDLHLGASPVKLLGTGFDLSGVVDVDIEGDPREVPYDIGMDAAVAAVVDISVILGGIGRDDTGRIVVDNGGTIANFINGLPVNALGALVIDAVGAVTQHLGSVPLTAEGRVAVETAVATRSQNGWSFSATDRIAVNADTPVLFTNSRGVNLDGGVCVSAAP